MGKRKRSGSFSNDDGDSQEELEGDALGIHKGNIVNGIRYSARVQEKQEKLRREASPSKQSLPDTAIITTTTITPAAVSPCQNITSNNKLSPVEVATEMPPVENTYITQTIIISGEKKKKRTWELWSHEDKQLFFEALNEFGKDFDAIQSYLASKLKPRSKTPCGQAVPKNKDQVRHFYYRTWNKISKYLTFPKDMKKAFQELYGLVNYGELRKKQRVLNSKTAVKLSELVEKGTTTIKVRGKTFRIKTPVCRALKRLNQLDDVDHIRVPCKLCVELVPYDGSTWASVQRVSHNPRVKVLVPLQRTLASLIIYFEERWKTDQSRLKEEFSLSMFGKPRTRLRFIPVEKRDLSVPIFKFSETTSATKVCLSSYVQNCLYQEHKQDSDIISKKFRRKYKHSIDSDLNAGLGGSGNRESDYLAAEADVSDIDGCEAIPENQFRILLRRDKLPSDVFMYGSKSDLFTDNDNSNGFNDNWCVHEENANAATETDAAETDYGFDENIPSPTDIDDRSGDEECLEPVISDNLLLYTIQDPDGKTEKICTCSANKSSELEDGTERQCCCIAKQLAGDGSGCKFLDSEALMRGWNAVEAGTITLGEIYLMLGKADRLCFEYTWDKCDEDKLQEYRANNLMDKLLGIARHLKKRKNNRAKSTAGVGSSMLGITPLACVKCNVKLESPTGVDGEPCTNALASGEFSQFGSPQRNSVQQLTDSAEKNQITLHASSPVSDDEQSLLAEFPPCESSAVESNPQAVCSSNANNNVDETQVTTDVNNSIKQELDHSANKTEEVGQSISVVMTDSIISKENNSNPSNVCSLQPILSQQTGLIDISTLATNNSTDIDTKFRRTTANIQATLLPTSIIGSVSMSSSCMMPDIAKATFRTCHAGTLTPVTSTTAVLVSEPIMFAGLTADSTPFVRLQPCSTVSSTRSVVHNTQESKFRRPADVPILAKPNLDERSTFEDGTSKLAVPKPFLDLPKGNRRIGRRPAWKQRVIIPRMLPLLPKPNKLTAMATLITLPPVVATGLSVVPVSTEQFNSVTPITVTAVHDLSSTAVNSVSGVHIVNSSTLKSISSVKNKNPASSLASRGISTSGASSLIPLTMSGLSNSITMSENKEHITNSSDDACLPTSSRNLTTTFEETLDSLSLSSFMDISIPESTRFIASDMNLEELEYSNSSMSLSGMLDETSRKNSRDPPLLDTPKKNSNSNDGQVDIPSPPRLTPLTSLETSWPSMNDGSDLFMGSLFSGHDALRSTTPTPEVNGDMCFQPSMEDSLDFDSKLHAFSSRISDNKD